MEDIYGVVHAHTYNSLKDSTLSPEDLVKRSKELGAKFVTLTDHGTMTGVFAFMNACKSAGIKGVPGVEAYVKDGEEDRRKHLILLPKNYKGYQAICRAVTRSNERLYGDFPCMNKPLLEELFAGKNDVIATTACAGGILGTILLRNEEVSTEITKLLDKLHTLENPEDVVFKRQKASLENIQITLAGRIQKREELTLLAGRKFTAKERALKGLSGTDYTIAQEKIQREKEEADRAKEDVVSVKAEITALKKEESALTKTIKEEEKKHEKYYSTCEKIDELNKKLLPEMSLYEEAKKEALWYKDCFGEGNFYIELQYHGFLGEEKVYPILYRMSQELDLPLVATNDIHLLDGSEAAQEARALIEGLRFNRWLRPEPGDEELYIKSDAKLKEMLLKILPSDAIEKGFQGIKTIGDSCYVEFPKEQHFPKFIENGHPVDAKLRLRELAKAGISWRYKPEEWTKAHEERLNYELSVIEDLEYCDYLCIVEDFLRYGRKLGTENPDNVGIGIGPGRGSGVGSLVCYLVGITSIDPLEYGLLFERFLNKERVSYPDIDSDIRTDIREKVISYVESKYGKEAVCGIVTKGTLAAKAALRAAARVLGDKIYNDGRYLYNLADKIAKQVPGEVGITLPSCEVVLRETFKDEKDAKKIIDAAMLIEGVPVTYGKHAAGVVISDNGDVGEYIPLMYNKEKNAWVTQCDLYEVEKQGLLKMDFLGLRNLDIITEALQSIKRNYGISLDIEKIPMETEVFEKIFATGKTHSVFQFESQGMREMLKNFQPSCIQDVILLVAAYRPGPLQYLDDIIAVKRGKKKSNYMIPQMREILEQTYGKPIYQEQIMQIFNKIAGFSLGEADIIRRYMSKKKTEKFAAYKDKFLDGMVASGANRNDAENFWEELLEFSRYAFNKAHACAYAFIAYYTAYLKYHYPAEYMCAVLNYSDTDKYGELVAECKNFGVKVLPPDINQSDFGFSVRGRGILFGLGSIKEVKESSRVLLEARKNGPFTDLKDLLFRVSPGIAVVKNLIAAGAMDGFGKSRATHLLALETLMDIRKKIQDTEKRIPGMKTESGQKTARKRMQEGEERWRTFVFSEVLDSKRAVLEKEKELLGMYVSGHPLDSYCISKIRKTEICNAKDGEYTTLCGLLTDVRISARKSDGAKMGFGIMEDETGKIEVCCFTKAYAQYADLFQPESVLAITGKVEYTESVVDSEETVKKIYVNEIETVAEERKDILLSVPNVIVWTEDIFHQVKGIEEKNGSTLHIHDRLTGEIRTANFAVSEKILEMDFGKEVTVSYLPL